jgi:hypothetical protein
MRARLSHQLVALQRPDGSLSYNPIEQAELLPTQFAQFAAASAAPVTTPQAQAAVLTAMITDSRYARAISMTAAEQAGAAIVTTAEVKEAMRALPARRSPGADGLQLELWRLADLAWAPVLACLNTAIFNQKRNPCHFADGHITPLHKAGSMCQPSNFRPITLLNSD